MDRFDSMRVFVRIVELMSFTKAADDLQLPRATVTHTIQQLERRLGVRLLHRTTRQVSATLDGEAYFQRCVRLLADVEEARPPGGAAGPGHLRQQDLSCQARRTQDAGSLQGPPRGELRKRHRQDPAIRVSR